ncbi:signal peptidase II [Brachybacterium tyrofermentans]|uniref:signal peptidase II n=1 Tax=Brachybacterium tyrofermentans TaxID=47848 RepID=UPI003F8FCD50
MGVLLAVVDQLTKNWAVSNLPELDPQPFLGEILHLTLLYNSGAAWGMGSEITPVVTGLQIAIVIGVIVFAVRSVRSLWYTLALGLILGGALGNIHDRLLRPPGPFHGAVVDFLELPHWPVFNVADMAVVGGAILVVLLGVIGLPADPAEAEERARAEAEDTAGAEDTTGADDSARADDIARADDVEHPEETR